MKRRSKEEKFYYSTGGQLKRQSVWRLITKYNVRFSRQEAWEYVLYLEELIEAGRLEDFFGSWRFEKWRYGMEMEARGA